MPEVKVKRLEKHGSKLHFVEVTEKVVKYLCSSCLACYAIQVGFDSKSYTHNRLGVIISKETIPNLQIDWKEIDSESDESNVVTSQRIMVLFVRNSQSK